MPLRIVPFSKTLDRAAFRSGVEALDDWFRSRASQDEKRNIARIFVAIDDHGLVAGFYSLSTYTLSIDELPGNYSGKLPRYDRLPAVLIGRLARDLRFKGQDIGGLLLGDALRRIIVANTSLAIHAILVEAKDARAKAFYESFGFIAFPLYQQRLFLPMSVAEKAFALAD